MKTRQESPTNRDPLFFTNGAKPQQKKEISHRHKTSNKTRAKKKKPSFPRRVQHEKPITVARTLLRHSQGQSDAAPTIPHGWMNVGRTGNFFFSLGLCPCSHKPHPQTRVEPPITKQSTRLPPLTTH